MAVLPDSLAAALSDSYRLEREIGAGGMATVYLAQDLKHDRRVAVKVLRPELAAVIGAERFLAEIKTTAHLQHPHILPLFDSGAAQGFLFYVMPFIEGESLRDRLTRDKQLPIGEAVRIATEVASALSSAHKQHVIHRDIKPENILLHDGSALVADFGIALAVSGASNTRMTETGMSLGTPHYMSPEQAMGEREIGPASDIYALGAVTYEMLVGEPPFTGPTAQAIIAKVVTEDPRPLSPKRHTIAPHVEAAVLTAIQKLPADRFASAAEFAAALGNPGYMGTNATMAHLGGTGAVLTKRDRLLARLAGPIGAVAVVALGAMAWVVSRPEVPLPVSRYSLAQPIDQMSIVERAFTIAPDGSAIAYIGPGPDGTQIWIKPRDQHRAIALPGTIGVFYGHFSPDGKSIGFVQGNQLKVLSIGGGAASTLADSVATTMGFAWMDDGTIVYIQLGGRQLRQIRDTGGESTIVWQADTLFASQLSPLPDGRGILYTACPATACVTAHDLWALDLGSGAQQRVMTNVVRGWYLPTGHLLFVRRNGSVSAVPFDLGTLEASGAAVPVLDSIAILNGITPLLAVSNNGTLLTRSGAAISAQPFYTMVGMDQAGRESVVDTSWRFQHVLAGGNVGWRISPDGRRLAIGLSTGAGDDIYVKTLPRGPLSRVTLDSTPEFRPRWTPDGMSVLYGNFIGADVMQRRADGTGPTLTLLDRPEGIYEFQISGDGKWLIYRTGGTVSVVGQRDIYAVRRGSDTVPVPIVANPRFDESAFDLSLDGRWLAYEGNENGRKEIYVRPFPNADSAKFQISTAGGVSPLWSRDGNELYFIDSNRDMMAIRMKSGNTLAPGEPRRLFRVPAEIYAPANENYTPFDVGADGRFLMARRVAGSTPLAVPLIVAENWFTELKAKMGER